MSCCNEPIAITNTVTLNNLPDSCGFNQTLDDYLTLIKRSNILGCEYGNFCSSNRFTVSYRFETPTLIRYDIQDHLYGMDETVFYPYVPELDTPDVLFEQIVKTQQMATNRNTLGNFVRVANLQSTEDIIYFATQRLNGLVLLRTTVTILTMDFKLIVTEPVTPVNPAEFALLLEYYTDPTVSESFKLMYRTVRTLKQKGYVINSITPVGDNYSYQIQLTLPLAVPEDELAAVRAIQATVRYTSEIDAQLKLQLEGLNACPS